MPPGHRSRAWVWVIVVWFAVFGFLTNRAGQIEHGSAQTTFPIISFEVAGGGDRAEQILSETVDSLDAVDDGDARDAVEAAVRRSLWWDFGFIVGYSLLIFTVAPALGRKLESPPWARLGKTIGWGGLLAGALDLVENLSLFRVLEDTSRDTWALLAAVVSWGKWILVVAALLYGLVGLIWLGARRITRPRTSVR